VGHDGIGESRRAISIVRAKSSDFHFQAQVHGRRTDGGRVTISAFVPYLSTILGLLSTFKATRAPLDKLASSKEFQDLLTSLAYVIDAIESKDPKGNESDKSDRLRRKADIRLWRVLREVSPMGQFKVPGARALIDVSYEMFCRTSCTRSLPSLWLNLRDWPC
jgi:hypothetical protein